MHVDWTQLTLPPSRKPFFALFQITSAGDEFIRPILNKKDG